MSNKKTFSSTKIEEIKIISNLDELKKIDFDEICFPNIDYNSNQKLNLNSTTILAAYTTISKKS